MGMEIDLGGFGSFFDSLERCDRDVMGKCPVCSVLAIV